jgi:hypothetical protein
MIYTDISIENDEEKIVVSTSNPMGVTIKIYNVCESNEETMCSFNLPRIKMIESLEHIIRHLKADL